MTSEHPFAVGISQISPQLLYNVKVCSWCGIFIKKIIHYFLDTDIKTRC